MIQDRIKAHTTSVAKYSYGGNMFYGAAPALTCNLLQTAPPVPCEYRLQPVCMHGCLHADMSAYLTNYPFLYGGAGVANFLICHTQHPVL